MLLWIAKRVYYNKENKGSLKLEMKNEPTKEVLQGFTFLRKLKFTKPRLSSEGISCRRKKKYQFQVNQSTKSNP